MSQHEPWQLGGNAEELYERYLVPAMFGPWATDLVALAAPQPGERVLDVACGTGVVARLVAPYVGSTGHVVGLDLRAVRLKSPWDAYGQFHRQQHQHRLYGAAAPASERAEVQVLERAAGSNRRP